MQRQLAVIVTSTLALLPAPAPAEITASSGEGFVSHNEVLVDVSPSEAWAVLLRPAEWWNGEHSYSGDVDNMTLVPRAGGCFCEEIPGPEGGPAGQIEHMRVLYVVPGSVLRLSGALGPLQSEAVSGVLTVRLEREGELTRISWDYVVGGYMRTAMDGMAPQVDQVVGEQLLRLAARLSAKVDPAPRRF